MVTILFDIDGTLMRSGGAGFKAIGQALAEVTGIDTVPDVDVHGRTDYGIMTDVFSKCGLSYNANRKSFDEKYWKYLPTYMAQSNGYLLPGVLELIETIHNRHDVQQGILTGNSREAAKIKLEHFQIDGFFSFGGYGNDHGQRNDVAGLALESAKQFLADSFDPNRVWVVGDTVNDVRCARAIDSRVIAVETGGSSRLDLAESNPDLILKDLSDPGEFLTQVFG